MNYRTLIGRHRAAIMGAAAALIVLFHAEWKTAPEPLGLLCREGQLGVDLFVFLTGFGLAHSLAKGPAPAEYWKRRLRRLLPAYYVWLGAMVLIALGLMIFAHRRGDFLRWLLLHILPVGVWLNRQPQVWYVSAALGYCALAPLIFALLNRSRWPRILTALLLLTAGLLLPAVSGMDGAEIALVRIPGLIVGLAVGLADARGEKGWQTGLAGLAALAALGLCLGFGAGLPLLKDLPARRLHRLTLNLLAPALAALLAFALEGLARTPLRFLNRAFAALGRVSLESYLAHVILSGLVRDTLRWPAPLVLFTLLAACYPLARAMAWAGDRLLALWDGLAPLLRRRDGV